jgi:hypothetical protein
MFRIDPNTLYSKKDLAEVLTGLADIDRFLDRIRPKSVIMGTYLGADLIEAIRATPDYRESRHRAQLEHEARAKRSSGKTGGRRNRPSRPIDLVTVDDLSA